VLYIAAGVGFSERKASAFFAFCHGREEPPLLLFCTKERDDVSEEEVRVDDPAQAHPTSADFFNNERIRSERYPHATVFAGDNRTKDPEFFHTFNQRMWVFIAMFHFTRNGFHFTLNKAAHGGNNLLLLFIQRNHMWCPLWLKSSPIDRL